MKRQKIRRLLLFLAMLLFPVTIYYFSPMLSVTASLEGIISGSFLTFAALFLGAIFFGRLFCAYACPAGALQGCASHINQKTPTRGWRSNIKYAVWGLLIIAVILGFVFSKSSVTVDPLYMTEGGISTTDLTAYIVYYAIILLILVPALIFGKRAFCHSLCWMAPFMILGTRLRRLLRLPGLHIAAKPEACVSCAKCNTVCPMSIDVKEQAAGGHIADVECIVCGECVDACPKKVLRYRMGREG